MSGAGQIQMQIDLAVAAAVAPLIQGLAALTKRVSELEHPTAKKAAPDRGTTARAGTASTAAKAHDTK